MVASVQEVIETVNNSSRFLSRNISNAAMQRARFYVPYVTGFLHDSIESGAVGNTVWLNAWAPYAHEVEFGFSGVEITGAYKAVTKAHKRKTATGTKKIRRHTKVYQGKKPMKVGESWITVGSSEGRQGKFFLKRGLEESIDEAIEELLFGLGARRVV